MHQEIVSVINRVRFHLTAPAYIWMITVQRYAKGAVMGITQQYATGAIAPAYRDAIFNAA
jgi:hypothetical protein